MAGPLLKLPKAKRERIARELQRGEIVLWAGQPRWTSALPAVGLKLLFGLFIAGFMLTWETIALGFFWDVFFGANRSRTPPALAVIFAVLGLPFVLAALAGLWSPLRQLRDARATLYAVTTQRLLMLIGPAGRRTQSIFPAGVLRIDRRGAPVIGGILTLTHRTKADTDDDSFETTSLLGLDDAAAVESAFLSIASSPAPAAGASRPA